MEKQNTEQAILDAAEELFLENGYHLASTTMIAKKAGVTHAMLHYYYRTKEQIFLKVVEKNFGLMLSEMQTEMISGHNLWEIIKGVTIKHFDFLSRHRQMPGLFLEMTKDFPDVITEFKDKIAETAITEINRHKSRLDAESEKGKMNNIDPIQLLFSGITMNMSPFLAIPFMKNVMELTEEEINLFLEERKQENLKTMYCRLFYKDIPQNL